jgi:hypothetical protein
MPRVDPDVVLLRGGLDVVSSPYLAAKGTARLAYNYEAAVGGGFERVGGIDWFDGRAAPYDAAYTILDLVADPTSGSVGNTINGQTSGATGVVIYISGARVVVTKVTGTFQDGENIRVVTTVIGVLDEQDGAVDGFLDNQLSALAANEYRLSITAVPGSGPVRGLAVLEDEVYAWRNNVGATAMVIHKATTSGWSAVTLYHELSFTLGTSEYSEGETITQGATTATVKRVVLISGTWGGGTAAGRLIITAPSGGVFAAGVSGGGGAATLSGASTQITLSPSGNVRWDWGQFSGQLTQRIYGCDGVNREFEFADDILVPIETGMGSVRASAVAVHRHHLFFAYLGSVQFSGISTPYIWSVITGAGEFATGDTITDLVSVAGSESNAALMVMCANSAHVMYGNSSANFSLKTISRKSGCSAGSARDINGVVALDQPGVARYSPTQSFGNFRWDRVSNQIEPLVRGQQCECSVWVASRSKYRLFFTDGTAVSGLLEPKGGFSWASIDYGVRIVKAVHAEIDGTPRTFYGDDQGYVYEADVGRSFAGSEIQAALRLNELNQGRVAFLKRYRRAEIEAKATSAFSLTAGGDFFDADNEIEQANQAILAQYGAGFNWDIENWDEAYWDVGDASRKRFALDGQGTSVAPIITSLAADELPHTLRSITIHHNTLRLAR